MCVYRRHGARAMAPVPPDGPGPRQPQTAPTARTAGVQLRVRPCEVHGSQAALSRAGLLGAGGSPGPRSAHAGRASVRPLGKGGPGPRVRRSGSAAAREALEEREHPPNLAVIPTHAPARARTHAPARARTHAPARARTHLPCPSHSSGGGASDLPPLWPARVRPRQEAPEASGEIWREVWWPESQALCTNGLSGVPGGPRERAGQAPQPALLGGSAVG